MKEVDTDIEMHTQSLMPIDTDRHTNTQKKQERHRCGDSHRHTGKSRDRNVKVNTQNSHVQSDAK